MMFLGTPKRGLWLALVCAMAAVMSPATADARRGRWRSDVLESFAHLPIQDGGRMKPISTFAAFKLMKFRGKRSCRDMEGRTLSPTAWLMDCLFYPEEASQYKVFRVENSDVLDAIGVPHRKRRDVYSARQIRKGEDRLREMAEQFLKLEPKKRSPYQMRMVALYTNYMEFRQILHGMAFARMEFNDLENGMIRTMFQPDALQAIVRTPYSALLGMSHDMASFFRAVDQDGTLSDDQKRKTMDVIEALYAKLMERADLSGLLRIFPVDAGNPDPTWNTPSTMFAKAFSPTGMTRKELALLGIFEKLAALRGDQDAFYAQLRDFHHRLHAQAAGTVDFDKISLEVFFYQGKFFYYSLVLFVVSFVLVSLSWFFPNSGWMHKLIPVAVLLPSLLLIAGIVIRCVLRSRPPITNLYETILFITATSVCAALLIEFFNRQRIAVSIASILGAVGLFVAYRYELKRDSADTMESLVAVLDSNFWLATHVTTINIGYAAGILSGAIAHVYIVARLFALSARKAFYKQIERMVYGSLCFGTLFATVGTVLGGIWANDSWGRFWGWDPKENGALMIVLWHLAILHARMGGYVRGLGMCAAAVFGTVIVTFSWWGVNLLSIGLHAYGFMDGLWSKLIAFWLVECVVVLCALIVWWMDGRRPDRRDPDRSR